MQLYAFKAAMKNEFEMTDLGLMRYFLGIEVKQTHDGILWVNKSMLLTF